MHSKYIVNDVNKTLNSITIQLLFANPIDIPFIILFLNKILSLIKYTPNVNGENFLISNIIDLLFNFIRKNIKNINILAIKIVGETYNNNNCEPISLSKILYEIYPNNIFDNHVIAIKLK